MTAEPRKQRTDKPSLTEIAEAVRAAGYLMEQEVADQLESLNFKVATNWAYQDPDEGKSREMDILATREFYSDDAKKLYINVCLICECKDNSSPFAFITRPTNPITFNLSPEEYVFPIQSILVEAEPLHDGTKRMVKTPAFQFLGLRKSHYYYSSYTKAVQFCEIVRNGKTWKAESGRSDNDLIFKLAKALNFQKSRIMRFLPDRNLSWSDPKYINLYFPVVVTRADLYLIDSSDKQILPRVADYVSYRKEVRTETINGNYVIDFTNIGMLKAHIEDRILPFVEHVANICRSEPDKFCVLNWHSE